MKSESYKKREEESIVRLILTFRKGIKFYEIHNSI